MQLLLSIFRCTLHEENCCNYAVSNHKINITEMNIDATYYVDFDIISLTMNVYL